MGFVLSDLDYAIIDILKQDGRTSNQAIADQLNISTSMVASRLKRLENDRAMKVVAVSDFSAFGHNILLPIGVDVKGRPARDVAEDLAKIDAVASVQLVTGRHDIEILVTLSDLSELSDFLTDALSRVKGVRSLDSAIAVDILKFDFDIAPI